MTRPRYLILAILVCLPGLAAAQDVRTVKKIDEMNRLAMEDYDIGDYAPAQKRLEETLVAIKAAKLEADPICVRTHVNLGVVLAAGVGDAEKAKAEFIAALEIDPKAEIPAALAAPATKKPWDAAKAELKKRADAADRAKRVGIEHIAIDTAREGELISLDAHVGPDLHAEKLVLYYRPDGAKAFIAVPMVVPKGADAGSFRAEIPAEATAVDAVAYYIEALNKKGKVVATRGNNGAPINIAVIRKPKDVPTGPEPEDDENPFEKKKK
jgi:hypothetical protein